MVKYSFYKCSIESKLETPSVIQNFPITENFLN